MIDRQLIPVASENGPSSYPMRCSQSKKMCNIVEDVMMYQRLQQFLQYFFKEIPILFVWGGRVIWLYGIDDTFTLDFIILDSSLQYAHLLAPGTLTSWPSHKAEFSRLHP